MKKQYILIFSLICSLFVKAQNYQPFPYDSVFFETSSSDRPLLPLVKSDDPENMIQPINNAVDWRSGSYHMDEWPLLDAVSNYFPYASWLGKVSIEDQIIEFETAMGNKIPIDLSHNIGESDTVFVQVPSTNAEFSFYVKITYDEKTSSPEDTIKHYRFHLLDENYEETDFYDSSIEWEAPFNIEDQVFSISKHNGIISSPAFYYFPNSLQYNYKAPIGELLDLSKPHAFEVFSNQAGDEIHTEYRRNDYLNSSTETSKKIYVDQEYNENLNAFISTADIWTRKDSLEYLFEEDDYLRTYTIAFDQVTDTTYLNDYPNLNRIVPDGFPHTFALNNENGYFYRALDHSFIRSKTNSIVYVEEFGVTINPETSSTSSSSHFQHQTGGPYHYSSPNPRQSWYKILYYNINSEEWGEPIEESYLLEIEENTFSKPELTLKDNAIILNDADRYENARIYNTNGELGAFIKSDYLQEKIDIQHLKKGIYILACWTGKTLHTYKFIKS